MKTQGKFTSKFTSKFTVGIDLGGTKVLAGLVDTEGRIHRQARRPTVPLWMTEQNPAQAAKPPTPARVREHIDYVVRAMTEAACEVAQPLMGSSRLRKQLLGVGLASAGPMKIDKGTLDYPSNFKGWKVVPLVAKLETSLAQSGLKSDVHFQNDAIAAALGEGWIGKARGCSTYAMITVGTGIGSGVIFCGRPAQSRGMGSEWGHMLIDVPGIAKHQDSFNSRSVEGFASGTGLIRRAHQRGLQLQSTSELADAARRGHAVCLELFSDASEALAALFYTLSLGFHPEKLVISGGMLPIRDLYLPQAVSLYKNMMIKKNPEFIAPVQIAKLGVSAGVIGAARLPHLYP